MTFPDPIGDMITRIRNGQMRMLNNENIDILSICTHADSHEDIVIAAVKNGVKAIFCEKPISNNLNWLSGHYNRRGSLHQGDSHRNFKTLNLKSNKHPTLSYYSSLASGRLAGGFLLFFIFSA